ncbi:MAG TPA: cytochrome c peroxidase [Kofleriaceae bacterium]
MCVLATISIVGCNLPGEGRVDVFTEEEWELVSQFGPLPEPRINTTNRYADSEAAAVFAQRLFFEKAYSNRLILSDGTLGVVGDKGRVSCASCHDPKMYYSDSRSRPNATSLGINWTQRNTPTLVNTVYYTWGSWGGKDDNPWAQGSNGSESSQNFGGNRLEFAHIVFKKYRADYDAIFPVPLDPALDPKHAEAARFPATGRPKSTMTAPDGPWELMASADRDIINTILANTGKAFEALERKLVSRNSPLDQYIAGDYNAITPGQKRGLKLFIGKAGCVDCHSGATFSDQGFHNTGVPQVGASVPRVDNGRFDDIQRTLSNTFNGAGKFSDDPDFGAAKIAEAAPEMIATDDMKGKFRTKSLRHVEKTGPYMHTGELQTLEDVVRFYNWGGGTSNFAGTKHPAMVPLDLSFQEEADLVEFMKALTGEPPPEQWAVDTALTELVVTKTGAGVGKVVSNPAGIDCPTDCVEQVSTGKVLVLTPMPEPGSSFTGWTGACTGTGGCSVTLDSDKAVSAAFAVTP